MISFFVLQISRSEKINPKNGQEGVCNSKSFSGHWDPQLSIFLPEALLEGSQPFERQSFDPPLKKLHQPQWKPFFS